MCQGPAEAVPRTTGCVRVTPRSQMPSLWPTYSFSSWQTAREPAVALKLDTIWGRGLRVQGENKLKCMEGDKVWMLCNVGYNVETSSCSGILS